MRIRPKLIVIIGVILCATTFFVVVIARDSIVDNGLKVINPAQETAVRAHAERLCEQQLKLHPILQTRRIACDNLLVFQMVEGSRSGVIFGARANGATLSAIFNLESNKQQEVFYERVWYLGECQKLGENTPSECTDASVDDVQDTGYPVSTNQD